MLVNANSVVAPYMPTVWYEPLHSVRSSTFYTTQCEMYKTLELLRSPCLKFGVSCDANFPEFVHSKCELDFEGNAA